MRRTGVLVLVLTALLAACQPGNETAPIAPAVDTKSEVAHAVLDGLHFEARLLPTTRLSPAMAQQYGIVTNENRSLLLLSVRNAEGNAVAVDDLQISAQVGDLLSPPQPVELRQIDTGGLLDFVADITARPPTTVRVALVIRKGEARTQLNFARELPKP